MNESIFMKRRGLEIAPAILTQEENDESNELNTPAKPTFIDKSPDIKPAAEIKNIQQFLTSGQDSKRKADTGSVLVHKDIPGQISPANSQVLVHKDIPGQISPANSQVLVHKGISLGPPARRYTIHSTDAKALKNRYRAMEKSIGKQRSQSIAGESPGFKGRSLENYTTFACDDKSEIDYRAHTGIAVTSANEAWVHTEETAKIENVNLDDAAENVEKERDLAEFVGEELKGETEIVSDEQEESSRKLSMDSMIAKMM
jgi:hypothetical protein